MAKKSALEVQETDNGWIVRTNYWCLGGERVSVFQKWKDALDFIQYSLREGES